MQILSFENTYLHFVEVYPSIFVEMSCFSCRNIFFPCCGNIFVPFYGNIFVSFCGNIFVHFCRNILVHYCGNIFVHFCGNIFYTRGNIFVYSLKYLCILVEILRRTIWRVVCAQECPANCKPVADIVFMHLLPLPARLQKRPNWGIKHNKSQNSRANFSGERGEMALLCIC